MNEVLLSIIIPCYNAEKYVGNLINSLLMEKIPEVEIIAINDGSKDHTLDVLHSFGKIEKFRVVDKKNEGVSVARNTGLMLARGHYVLFMDADDQVSKGTLSFYIRCIKNAQKKCHEIPILAFGYISEKNHKIVQQYAWSEYDQHIFNNEELNKTALTKRIWFHICSCLFERKYLQMNQLKFQPGLNIGEDIDFLLRAMAKADHLQYFKRICFKYQIHEDSAMKGYTSYSEEQFNSFLVNKKDTQELSTRKLARYYNFFIANSYLSNLNYYIRSKVSNENIRKGFIDNQYVLKTAMASENRKIYLLIKLASWLPIALVLKILRK